MPALNMRWPRSHPILTAAIIGAAVGIAQVLVVELGGMLHKNSSAVLLLLPSTAAPGHPNQLSVMQTSFILLLDFAGNAVGYALLFAVPVAIVVVILRIFGKRGKKPVT